MTKILAFISKVNVWASNEPVAVGAAFAAVIAVLAGFGVVVHLTPEQIGGVMAAIAAVTGLVVRTKVAPVPVPAPEAPGK